MRKALAACALLLLLCTGRGAAAEGVSEAVLQQAGLPSMTVEGVRVYHSASAAAQAGTYGQAIAGALAWYRAQLGWEGEVSLVVLDRADWRRFVLFLPYPVPHAERAWNLVVMPDSIRQFPGFARWGLDGETLNLGLTFHEIGHVVAEQIGLRSGNFWIEELIANLFLAAYVRAEHPELSGILAGVPAGFSNPGPFDQLFDFDTFYAAGGLENYAWFQFRLALLADRMAGTTAFPALIAGMRQAFPAEQVAIRRTVAWTLATLEAIAPGSTAAVGDMAGDGLLPQLTPAACDTLPASAARAEGLLLLDNRSAEALAVELPENGRLVVEADQVLPLQGRQGTLIALPDGRCLAMPEGAARYSLPAPP